MNPEITDQTLVLQRLKEGDEKNFRIVISSLLRRIMLFANKILKG